MAVIFPLYLGCGLFKGELRRHFLVLRARGSHICKVKGFRGSSIIKERTDLRFPCP